MPTTARHPVVVGTVAAATAILTLSTLLGSPVASARAPAQDGGLGWHCWDDGSPDPCHFDLIDLHRHRPDAGWAVGRYGRILQWDGRAWSIARSPTTESLYDVLSLNDRAAWAVGANGALLRWDGVSWTKQPSPIQRTLYTIAMASETDGWLGTGNTSYAGDAAELFHWDGTAWTRAERPAGLESEWVDVVLDIDMVSSREGWAVGATGYYTSFPFYRRRGVMLHWDGTTWSKAGSYGSDPVIDLDLVSDRDGWAAGPDGAVHRLRWDAAAGKAAWERFGSTGQTHFAMRSAADGWASNGAKVFRWDGTAWQSSATLDAGVAALDAAGTGDVWAAGTDGLLARGGSAPWTTVAHRARSGDFGALAAVSPGEVWAVGGKGAIMRFDGGDWRPVDSPTTLSLTDVAFHGAADGWAVGEAGTIVRFDGSSWTRAASPVTTTLNAVVLNGPDSGWAVGEAGAILHLDGDHWQKVASPTGQRLADVSSVAPDEVWAVGGTGGSVSLRWDGQRWEDIPVPDSARLSAVSMLTGSFGWAGLDGAEALLDWDGGGWSARRYYSAPTGTSVNAITFADRRSGWAVTSSGSILRWDGAAWEPVADRFGSAVTDVTLDGAGGGWAVGRAAYDRPIFLRLGPDGAPGPTLTPLPTFTLTPVPTRTPLPSRTPSASVTPTPSDTPTPTPTPVPLPAYLPMTFRHWPPLPYPPALSPIDSQGNKTFYAVVWETLTA